MGKPLAVYYIGPKSHSNYKRLSEETSSGSICSNEVMLQVSIHEMGFGGVGGSGYGRYGGYEGFK